MRHLTAFQNSGKLWNANTCNNTGRTNRPGANTNLHRISTCLRQRLDRIGGGNVTGNDLDIAKFCFDLLDSLDHTRGMTVCGINHQNINARFDKGRCTLKPGFANTGCRCCAKTTTFVLTGVRVQFGFFDVLDRDQAGTAIGIINHQQLFNPVLVQKFFGFFGIYVFGDRDQTFKGHQFGNRLRAIGGKTHIAVGQDANQLVCAAFDNRDTGNVIDVHKIKRISQRLIGMNGNWVHHHARFELLHTANFFGLLDNIEVLVNDPHAAMLCHHNRHCTFGYGIHSRGKQRDFQVNLFGNAGICLHLSRQNFGCGGFDQYVVKRQGFCYAGHLATSLI